MITGTPFNPASPQAHAITQLFVAVIGIMAFILTLVTGLVLYAAFRYRQRPGSGEPVQRFGHVRLEAGWTVGFVLILAFLFIFTVRTVESADPSVPDGRPPDLIVTGHQWWWEAEYPGQIRTANEIHIPTGKALLVELRSADVIHDWWVPQLGRKMDAIPGAPNRFWMEADRPGSYLGTCSEYCGVEHAWMRIQVIAQPERNFDRWLAEQAQAPPKPASGSAAQGADLFQKITCGNCHTVAGTPAKARIGPDLSHGASRATLASGRLENTVSNLNKWLADPQSIKPGVAMPNFRLTQDQVNELTAYLETLK